jgi:hypothetical protein
VRGLATVWCAQAPSCKRHACYQPSRQLGQQLEGQVPSCNPPGRFFKRGDQASMAVGPATTRPCKTKHARHGWASHFSEECSNASRSCSCKHIMCSAAEHNTTAPCMPAQPWVTKQQPCVTRNYQHTCIYHLHLCTCQSECACNACLDSCNSAIETARKTGYEGRCR